ncbi:MAG: hypothetical protein EZS28_042969 [Streblomastix strix]|uniref:Uncharacterized protein n=1 Tax=Streblomastix strix TaxID=222440 RepID=A0A5J4TT76_9EUKA|nr:MAG: hypothetical protein EZS28_042969 [Streblomastix strix]
MKEEENKGNKRMRLVEEDSEINDIKIDSDIHRVDLTSISDILCDGYNEEQQDDDKDDNEKINTEEQTELNENIKDVENNEIKEKQNHDDQQWECISEFDEVQEEDLVLRRIMKLHGMEEDTKVEKKIVAPKHGQLLPVGAVRRNVKIFSLIMHRMSEKH